MESNLKRSLTGIVICNLYQIVLSLGALAFFIFLGYGFYGMYKETTSNQSIFPLAIAMIGLFGALIALTQIFISLVTLTTIKSGLKWVYYLNFANLIVSLIILQPFSLPLIFLIILLNKNEIKVHYKIR